jgi:hypothetical protein
MSDGDNDAGLLRVFGEAFERLVAQHRALTAAPFDKSVADAHRTCLKEYVDLAYEWRLRQSQR